MQNKFSNLVWLAGGVALIVAQAWWPRAVLAQDEEHAEESPLIQSMEVIEDGLRALRGDLTDLAKLEARLGLVVEMQSAAKTGKTLLPPLSEKQPEADRAAFSKAYRQEMIKVELELLRLEQAILEGNLDAAKASYKTLKQMEEDGHARFTEDG